MKFVIFSPTIQTGGPFALMQLFDAIKSLDCQCEIVFSDIAKVQVNEEGAFVEYTGEIPSELGGIKPIQCNTFSRDDILIFPEVSIQLATQLANVRFKNRVIWWLSWDNANLSSLNWFDNSRSLSSSVHIFQSHYARSMAKQYGYDGPIVSDYTIYEYESYPPKTLKNNDICFLGRKAIGSEDLIAEISKEFSVIKIEGMTQNEVTEVLARTRFFLDFGAHPGKDRIPREAIIYDCIPVVRRVGAGAYFEDVPLPDFLRPTTDELLAPEVLFNLIKVTRDEHLGFVQLLNHYKLRTLNEKATFMEEVSYFLGSCYHISNRNRR
jgi:hypothetical protein